MDRRTRRSVYRRGQTGSERQLATNRKKLKPRYPTPVRGLREPSFRRPLERIGDPQISPTRQNFLVSDSYSADKRRFSSHVIPRIIIPRRGYCTYSRIGLTVQTVVTPAVIVVGRSP